MPEYDHYHNMTLSEYFSQLDPFLIVVTGLVVLGFICCIGLVFDAVIRAVNKEAP